MGWHRLTQKAKYFIVHQLHSLGFRNLDLLITPTLDSHKLMLSEFPCLTHTPHAQIPNGVDHNLFRPTPLSGKRSLRRKWGIPPESQVILSIGRINREKNIHLLLNIFAKIDPILRSVLLVAFPTPTSTQDALYLIYLCDLAQKLRIDQKILWLENPRSIAETYQLSDICISLSQKEVAPLTLLESLTCGVPFLSSTTGSTKEILSHIDTNLVLAKSTKEQVKQISHSLSQNKQLQIALKKKCLSAARKFSWERSTQRLTQEITNYSLH